MKRIVRKLFPRVLELAASIFGKRGHVVVHGFPADEGNAVETIRALGRHYRGTIYWLIDDPENWTAGEHLGSLKVLRKNSLQALKRYTTAEAVFFTHGLYGDSRPQRGQIFVNLWHGDGFKIKPDARASRRSLYPSNYVVGGTHLLTAQKAADFKIAPTQVLITGNPRVDEFTVAPKSSLMRELGLDGDAPFVVWMPTFRRSKGAGATAGWADVSESAERANNSMGAIVASLNARGIAVVVKPHPQDAEAQSVEGAVTVSNELLAEHRTSLYSLLGASAGLITDYSSVWTDYLLLDRPIAFHVPDLDDYLSSRGLFVPDLFDWVPGQKLESPSAVDEFADEIFDGSAPGAARRGHAAKKLGLADVAPGGSAAALVTALAERGAFERGGATAPAPDDAEAVPLIWKARQ